MASLSQLVPDGSGGLINSGLLMNDVAQAFGTEALGTNVTQLNNSFPSLPMGDTFSISSVGDWFTNNQSSILIIGAFLIGVPILISALEKKR